MRARVAWQLIVPTVVLVVALLAPHPAPSGAQTTTPTVPAFCRPGPAGATPGPITASTMMTPGGGGAGKMMTPRALTPSPMMTPSTGGADRVRRPDVMTPSLLRTPKAKGVGQMWTPSARTSSPMMPAGAGSAGRMDGQGELMALDVLRQQDDLVVAIAHIAIARAAHPELTRFAQTLIPTRDRERQQVQAWRDQWYAGAPTPPWDPRLGLPREVVAHLCAATGAVDLAIIDALMAQDQQAVALAQRTQPAVTHSAFASFLHDVVDGRTREQDQLHAWRQAWAGATVGTPAATAS